MSNYLMITITAFDELIVDRESGEVTGTKSGWRLRAEVDRVYLLMDHECEDERDVRNLLYRLADHHIPKIVPKSGDIR